jgi:hypothetical protein
MLKAIFYNVLSWNSTERCHLPAHTLAHTHWQHEPPTCPLQRSCGPFTPPPDTAAFPCTLYCGSHRTICSERALCMCGRLAYIPPRVRDRSLFNFNHPNSATQFIAKSVHHALTTGYATIPLRQVLRWYTMPGRRGRNRCRCLSCLLQRRVPEPRSLRPRTL